MTSKIKARKVNCPSYTKSMYNYNLQRHLKTCIKNKFCPICQKDTSEDSINEHVEECGKTYYPCNVCGKRFNTATKRTTHEMNIKNSKVKADFGRFKIITINIQLDYLITLEDKVEHITDILNHEMKSSLKFYKTIKSLIFLLGLGLMLGFSLGFYSYSIIYLYLTV